MLPITPPRPTAGAVSAHDAHMAHLAHLRNTGQPIPKPVVITDPKPPATPVKPPAPVAPTGASNDAYLFLKNLFDSYGLGSLSAKILEYVQHGYSSDSISVLLQQTDEYKKRFAGNEVRRKAGLNVLTPAEYISTENSYRQILRAGGMPTGFWDSTDDFTSLIGRDVAPQEMQDRVSSAVDATVNADPFYKQALRSVFGASDADMVSIFLDPDRAKPLLEQKARTAQIGAAAMQQGLAFDQTTAEMYAQQGVDRKQANQAYGTIAEFLPNAQKLGTIYGDQYNQSTAEQEVLGNSGAAAAKRKTLSAKETANFSGQAGTNKSSLTRQATGAY